MASSRSLLVNFWYASPVGHAIEALRYCLGYHRADRSLRVSLLLNGSTAVELADFCPFVETTYAVDFTDFHDERHDPVEALRDVPRDWDYVVRDGRADLEEQLRHFAGLRRFYEASAGHFRPRLGSGIAGAEPPAYEPHQQLRLALPAEARARALDELGAYARRIAIMPAGSGGEHGRPLYPSAGSWELILGELGGIYPGALFCLVGKLARDGRTSSAMGRDEIDRLAAVCPSALDCFDRPLADQLAVVEACDLFLSPHTGFGTAALAVGTPWLTLSGGPWPEYVFNGVPFHSLLPDTRRYPCYTGLEALPVLASDEDGEGPRTPSMSRTRIIEDLPELLEAAEELIEGRLSYDHALREHFPRLLAACGGDRSRIFSIDAIHDRYL